MAQLKWVSHLWKLILKANWAELKSKSSTHALSQPVEEDNVKQ